MNQGKRVKVAFGCGHKGLGTSCHRCARAEVLDQRAKDGNTVAYDVSKAKKVFGFDRKQRVVKATDQQIVAMRVEASRLRALPGQKPQSVVGVTKTRTTEELAEVINGAPIEKPKKPEHTVESLQKKFAEQGPVAASTLKAQQRAARKK